MSASYQRFHATGSQGGEDSQASLRSVSQWTGSEHTPSGANTAGDRVQEDGIGLEPDLEEVEQHEVNRVPGWAILERRLRRVTCRQISFVLFLAFVILTGAWLMHGNMKHLGSGMTKPADVYSPPVAAAHDLRSKEADPIQWLRDNTHGTLDHLSAKEIGYIQSTRPKAALIALVRNSERDAMIQSITQVEARFNDRETHHYDWVFFNNEEFTEDFKTSVAQATGSQCYFEVIPPEHWSIPSWIDQSRFDVGRQFLGRIGVGKAWLESYHHMCRWNSGLFAFEKRLADYDYYWRVEPGVKYLCDINYDVFRFMNDNNMAYGFNIALLEDSRAIPSLWEHTKDFIANNLDMMADVTDLCWLLHSPEEDTDCSSKPFLDVRQVLESEYNNCQFYSNFEIGSLEFFRGAKNMAFFDYLDKRGAFYYERLGDAPFHTLSVSMFLPKSRVWFFRDIGYSHSICEQCPPHMADSLVRSEPDAPQADEITDEATNTVANKVNIKYTNDVDAVMVTSDVVATKMTGEVDVIKVISDEPYETSTEETYKVAGQRTSEKSSAEASTQEPKTLTEELDDIMDNLMDEPYVRWRLVARELLRHHRGIPGLACGCTASSFDVNNKKLIPYESHQRKPSDTCIRRWLGGKWLERKPGWSLEADLAMGGSGYGGYVLDSLLTNPFADPFAETPLNMS